LLGKLDGNDELDSLLENIVQNTEELKTLQSEGGAEGSGSPGTAPVGESTEAVPS
jgi:type VI secretion system protein ImpB